MIERLATAALLVLAACGDSDTTAAGGAGSGGGGNAGGGSSSTTKAQVRFAYATDWNAHLGCSAVADYRIKFGASPVPITVPIDTTADSTTPYVELEGRLYADADVLHIYTCDGTTDEQFGVFGVDLTLEPAKSYTVTLAGAAATVSEDP